MPLLDFILGLFLILYQKITLAWGVKFHLSVQAKRIIIFLDILSVVAVHNEQGKSGLLWCGEEKSNISLSWKNISQSLMWKRISTSNKGPADHRTTAMPSSVSKEELYLSKSVCPGKQELFNNCKSEIMMSTPSCPLHPLGPESQLKCSNIIRCFEVGLALIEVQLFT